MAIIIIQISSKEIDANPLSINQIQFIIQAIQKKKKKLLVTAENLGKSQH